MRWPEVRASHPEQWLVIEALEAHSEDDHRIFDRIAVIATLYPRHLALTSSLAIVPSPRPRWSILRRHVHRSTRSARERSFTTLDFALEGRQDALSESNAHSARDGWSAAEKGRTPDLVVVARRTVGMAPCATPYETGLRGWTTPERSRLRTNMSRNGGAQAPPLPDSS